MYAIVEIAGKQFRVEKDQKIKVPLLPVESGKKVHFDRVLFYADDAGASQVGAPLVSGLQVEATVLEHGRDKKIIVFKKKRRKGYQKKNGHRQHFSLIQIEGISKAKAKPAKKETAAKKEEKPKAAAKETKAKTAEAPKTAKKAAPAKAKPEAKGKKTAEPKTAKTTSKAKTAAKPKADKKSSAGEKEA